MLSFTPHDEDVGFGATAERAGKDGGVDTIAAIWAGWARAYRTEA